MPLAPARRCRRSPFKAQLGSRAGNHGGALVLLPAARCRPLTLLPRQVGKNKRISKGKGGKGGRKKAYVP